MRRLLALIPVVVLAAFALMFAVYGLRHDPQVQPMALVGRPLPTIALPSLDGGAPRTVRQAMTGPTLVNFFFSTCAPCAAEAPQLMQLSQRGVPIIGVDYKDGGDPRLFLDRLGNPFTTVLVDRNGDAGVEFGITGAPETFLVDAHGKIIDKHVGVITDADVAELAKRMKALQAAS